METVSQQQASAFAEIDEIDRACLKAAYAGLSTKEMVRHGIRRSEHTINNRLSSLTRRVGAGGRFQAAKLYMAFLNQQEVTENLPTSDEPIANGTEINPHSVSQAPVSVPPIFDVVNPDADPQKSNPERDHSPPSGLAAVDFEGWWSALVQVGGMGRGPTWVHPSSRTRVSREGVSRTHHSDPQGEANLPASGRIGVPSSSGSRASVGLSVGKRRGEANALIYAQRIRAVFVLAAIIGVFGSGIIILMIGLIEFAAKFLSRLTQ